MTYLRPILKRAEALDMPDLITLSIAISELILDKYAELEGLR